MVRARPTLPAGHGELLTRPDYSEWNALLERNKVLAASWTFAVAGEPVERFRAHARAEFLDVAERFSQRLGVDLAAVPGSDAPIVATGHQPDLYHPGVWIKPFLAERLARESGAAAVDVVVDSDGFDTVRVSAPCLRPGVMRCRQYLALGTPGGCYACAPVPSSKAIDDFCASADEMLKTLPSPAVRRHFQDFALALRSASSDAENLAELVTFARRRFESVAGSGYLEAPITGLARTKAWAGFVADLALHADRFASAYNAELRAYRLATKTRSAAQPFPDLDVTDTVELPLWAIIGGVRSTVRVRRTPTSIALEAEVGGETVALVDAPPDPGALVEAIQAADAVLAPKALALTLFTRMFCCDLFIHGVGGGRYDRVTDGVIRCFYGVEPPGFAVASLTMYLPIGAHVVTDEEVSAARERLNRLEHNPDALLDAVEFESPVERDAALALAAEKADLVALIGAPDADRKALGIRIREVNAELALLLAPLRAEFEAELASLEGQRDASEILTDRTYPFCFWSPAEIADKAR